MNKPHEAKTIRLIDGKYINMLFYKMGILNYFDFSTSCTYRSMSPHAMLLIYKVQATKDNGRHIRCKQIECASHRLCGQTTFDVSRPMFAGNE